MSLTAYRLWTYALVQRSLVLKGFALTRTVANPARTATTDATTSAYLPTPSWFEHLFHNPRHGGQSTVPTGKLPDSRLRHCWVLRTAHERGPWPV